MPVPSPRAFCASTYTALWPGISYCRTCRLSCETYPEIELHMTEGDRLVDLIREGIDCVLRVGTPQDS